MRLRLINITNVTLVQKTLKLFLPYHTAREDKQTSILTWQYNIRLSEPYCGMMIKQKNSSLFGKTLTASGKWCAYASRPLIGCQNRPTAEHRKLIC